MRMRVRRGGNIEVYGWHIVVALTLFFPPSIHIEAFRLDIGFELF